MEMTKSPTSESSIEQKVQVQSGIDHSREINDFILLTACELVTVIHEYRYDPYFNQLAKTDARTPNGVSYDEIPSSLQVLKDSGWLLCTASHWNNIGLDNAYQGVVLINSQQKLALLAHRGMQLLIPNLANCLQIGAKKLPRIVKWVTKFRPF